MSEVTEPVSKTSIQEYADWTNTVSVYPHAGMGEDDGISYVLLGLSGEVGEVCNKYKKVLRGDTLGSWENVCAKIEPELGDCMFYLIRACIEFGVDPQELLDNNKAKLDSRKERNALKGEGDNR